MATRASYGEGELKEIRPNVWACRISLGVDPTTGKRMRAYHTFYGSKTSAKKQKQVLLARYQHEPVVNHELTVEDLVRQFIEACKLRKRSPKTVYEYERKAGKHILSYPIAKKRAAAVTVHDLEVHYAALGEGESPLSAQSILNVHSILRATFKEAVRRGQLSKAVTTEVRLPKVEKRKLIVPSAETCTSIITTMVTPNPQNGKVVDRAFVMAAVIAMATACRRSEVVALRWSDIDFKEMTLTIDEGYFSIPGLRGTKSTKSGQVRTQPMSPQLAAQLDAWRSRCEELAAEKGLTVEPEGFVCSLRRDGTMPLSPDSLSQSWTRAAKRSGHDGVRFHDLRHAAVTRMLAAGVPLADVQSIAGHAAIETTLIYAHATTSGVKQGIDQLGADIPNIDDVAPKVPGLQ